ncbi:hypothetical protein [Humisphaera borealis]|uniref:Uncharacterized protein n=1 Tax=Humisphaera borealis TaxID=2807512 RepID=A0A7M2X0F3_9BACT|nr:hypothetical protein [Humisphaera borealis]QOV90220.1 hypothetical protein IPV69_02270 [Humisphaera borealis]
MRSQLPDSEALLLMYAADELPPRDRQTVTEQLQQEAGLQARLDAILADLDLVEQRFESADAFDGLNAEHATRRAVDAIRGWQLVRPAASEPVRSPLETHRRWGWASAVAAVVALGLGVAALITYLNPPSASRMVQVDGLPDLNAEGNENALALHAATSLAMGLEVEDEAAVNVPMPPTSDEAIVSTERPFFEIPLIADADDGSAP